MFFRLPFDNSQVNRICPDDQRVLHHFSEYAFIEVIYRFSTIQVENAIDFSEPKTLCEEKKKLLQTAFFNFLTACNGYTCGISFLAMFYRPRVMLLH